MSERHTTQKGAINSLSEFPGPGNLNFLKVTQIQKNWRGTGTMKWEGGDGNVFFPLSN